MQIVCKQLNAIELCVPGTKHFLNLSLLSDDVLSKIDKIRLPEMRHELGIEEIGALGYLLSRLANVTVIETYKIMAYNVCSILGDASFHLPRLNDLNVGSFTSLSSPIIVRFIKRYGKQLTALPSIPDHNGASIAEFENFFTPLSNLRQLDLTHSFRDSLNFSNASDFYKVIARSCPNLAIMVARDVDIGFEFCD